jgi:hypothetical protein
LTTLERTRLPFSTIAAAVSSQELSMPNIFIFVYYTIFLVIFTGVECGLIMLIFL